MKDFKWVRVEDVGGGGWRDTCVEDGYFQEEPRNRRNHADEIVELGCQRNQ